jgi:hypothetical protein
MIDRIGSNTISDQFSALAAVRGLTPGTLRALEQTGRKIDAQDPQVAQIAATQFVAETFFAPLLAQMRDFPFGRDLALGGQTESVFGAQLDQRVAETVAGSNGGLIQQVVGYMERLGQPQPVGTDRATWNVQTQLDARPEDSQ